MENIHIPHDYRDKCIFCLIASIDTISVIADRGLDSMLRYQKECDAVASYASFGATREVMDRAEVILRSIRDAGITGHPNLIYGIGSAALGQLDENWDLFFTEQGRVQGMLEGQAGVEAARRLTWCMDGVMCKMLSAGVQHGAKRLADESLSDLHESYKVVVSRHFFEMLLCERRFESDKYEDEHYWTEVVRAATNGVSASAGHVIPEVVRRAARERGRDG